MHEMSLAIGLLERVLAEARKAGLTSVTRVEVEIGALASVEPQLLGDAFSAVAEGGPAQGARLVPLPTPARARCRACGRDFEPTYIAYVCPACGQADVEILSGKDLFIRSLTGEAPDS